MKIYKIVSAMHPKTKDKNTPKLALDHRARLKTAKEDTN